ncbi:MAG: YicC family protein [Bacteroidetes bacterium]|nr:YicC family protein [Bacteroidota bacterium]
MTGFGRHTEQLGADKITVEIKSLNSKGLDLSLRLPQSLRAHELDLRKIIGESAVRGKVEAYLYIESETPKTPAQINEPIVREYLKQIAAIAAGDELQALSLALKMPEALSQEKQETNPDQLQHVNRVLAQALQALHDFRAQEGQELMSDIEQRITLIGTHLETIVSLDVHRRESVRERLHSAVSQLKETIDENRFEQELIYYLEKYDITEEKVRLTNHLAYFIQTAKDSDEPGKKLGFIAQEIGREINTIGSKANDAAIQREVVQMKDELEKIKEQLLNVL